MEKLLFLIFSAILLTGCNDSFHDIKEAVSGITSRADDAAYAISLEVHTIRAIEIQHQNETFTINDLFKTTLRDVQWNYDEQAQQLKVTGTWKDNGLFANQNFKGIEKKQLLEHGEIEVLLTIKDGLLIEDKTLVKMQHNENSLINYSGLEALQQFYQVYITQ
jgi:hypothetical protein